MNMNVLRWNGGLINKRVLDDAADLKSEKEDILFVWMYLWYRRLAACSNTYLNIFPFFWEKYTNTLLNFEERN
jgi:hypothetical protein